VILQLDLSQPRRLILKITDFILKLFFEPSSVLFEFKGALTGQRLCGLLGVGFVHGAVRVGWALLGLLDGRASERVFF
jgi:hypothetical protein